MTFNDVHRIIIEVTALLGEVFVCASFLLRALRELRNENRERVPVKREESKDPQ
jgi:hypothetical protein